MEEKILSYTSLLSSFHLSKALLNCFFPYLSIELVWGILAFPGICCTTSYVRPGIYLLTTEDLIAFASHYQEHHVSPTEQDSFQDYVRKEIFPEQYGMSEKTLQRHHKQGLLKVYRLGNKLYLKKSQVVAALELGQV